MAVQAKQGAVRLVPTACAKPWGRRDFGAWGAGLALGDERIGEIHHCLPVGVGGDDPELLVKTLFTSERLSIQVHPDMAAARAAGHARGKDEAWVVLAAAPGAEIGIGLQASMTAQALRAAAIDGTIEGMMEWHPCAPGDVFFTVAGTIHAIGAGVTVFEVQQNLDVTYRLFDYGRGRALHLDDGMAVVRPEPWHRQAVLASPGAGRELLVAGPGFVLERVRFSGAGVLQPAAGRPVWVAVVAGTGTIGGAAFGTGEVWLAETTVEIAGEGEILLACSGADALADLWQAA